MKRLVLLFALLILAPTHARAWGDDGHRIVCAIAWDEMTPPIRARIEDILNISGKEAFAESCLWADDVRYWRPETAPQHYINIARGADLNIARGADLPDLARDCPQPRSCVVAAADAAAENLRRTASPDALRFLSHFIGDMHQPLHAGFADDRGGNLITGTFMGQATNMHDVWDSGLLAVDGRPWPELARDLESRITQADRWTWIGGTTLDWATESYLLGRSEAVGYHAYRPGFVFGRDYFDANIGAVFERLQRAGVRLAELLTNTLS